MHIELAKRTQSIQPSPTLALSARAAELRAAGHDIINFSVGEPDFDTPEHIKEAARAALAAGKTKYTPVDGIPELKQAIVDKFAQDNQLSYQPDQVLVSCGGKQSIYNLAQALLNPGDEVIIPAPYWVSYPDIMKLAEAKPVIIETNFEQQYKLNAEQLAATITPQTRLLVLNSPSNPTGIAYGEAELKALADVLLQHPQVLIATDDMYEHILFGDKQFVNILNVCPELYDRTIVLNGVSKAYSMTGWRIGYAAGPKPLIATMKKIQSQSTSNPCSIAQAAAVAALAGSQQCVKDMVCAFAERHQYIHQRLNAMSGVRAQAADGTFYIFPDISGVLSAHERFTDDMAFVEYLINEAQITPVPGSAFGCPGALRISFATSLENITQGMDRLEQAIARA